MRFAILASGSSGNAAVVEAGGTSILIDCGLSVRRLEQRAADLGFSLSELAGIAVTPCAEGSDRLPRLERTAIPAAMTMIPPAIAKRSLPSLCFVGWLIANLLVVSRPAER